MGVLVNRDEAYLWREPSGGPAKWDKASEGPYLGTDRPGRYLDTWTPYLHQSQTEAEIRVPPPPPRKEAAQPRPLL